MSALPVSPLELLIYWLILANCVGFVLMVVDKNRAENDDWRIRESTLLGWAFLGGALGTFAASRLVRHKTRKEPFASWLNSYVVIQTVLAILWLFGLFDAIIAVALELYRAAR